jgi:hypothetical protein
MICEGKVKWFDDKINKKVIDQLSEVAENIHYGEVKLVIKKGKVKFIESKKSKKIV